MAGNLKVVDFPYGETLRNAPAKLRRIADQIEAGKYGEVGAVGVVLLGDRLEVFGLGDGVGEDSMAPSVGVLFSAAHLRVAKMIEEHGRE